MKKHLIVFLSVVGGWAGPALAQAQVGTSAACRLDGGAGCGGQGTVTLTGTQTLTNKRITPRVGSTTSSATPTINTDLYDYYALTAQAADITSFTTNLSGTPTEGQVLWISIKGTATRAITWGASFSSSAVTLPTTTNGTQRLDVSFVWDPASSTWLCVGATTAAPIVTTALGGLGADNSAATGVPLFSSGTVTMTATTGTGNVQRVGGQTKVVNMFHGTMAPDTTGDAFFEPYAILATNDKFSQLVLRCGASNAAQPTVQAGAYGVIHVPEDFNASGTTTVEIYWTSTITSGNVAWSLGYRSIGGTDTTSLDQATYVETLTATAAAPSAANRRIKTSLTVTSANIAAGDTLTFYFSRDGTAGADTMAGSALVFELIFKYTT